MFGVPAGRLQRFKRTATEQPGVGVRPSAACSAEHIRKTRDHPMPSSRPLWPWRDGGGCDRWPTMCSITARLTPRW